MQPATDQPYVFLSYASADRERALAIADQLTASGVRVWMDRASIAAEIERKRREMGFREE